MEKGVLLRYFPGIGAAYMGVLIYALYRYLTFPDNLLPGYYAELLTAVVVFIASAFLLWLKVRAVELIPMVVVLVMITLWTVYDIDIQCSQR